MMRGFDRRQQCLNERAGKRVGLGGAIKREACYLAFAGNQQIRHYRVARTSAERSQKFGTVVFE